jgi:prepilin-type processing-associated H-X9-DG protein
MFLAVSLLALLASPQAADGASKAVAVAPFVGEDVAAVVQIDLAKWEVPGSSRRVLGKMLGDEDVAEVAGFLDGRVAALKKAGATDLFLLVDPADLPGFPIAVVRAVDGSDARAIAEVLTGEGGASSLRWPMAETIRGAVVAGSPAALARVRDAKPVPHPELAAALAAGGDSAIRIALIPTVAQRRAIEESFPTLSPQLGGGPIEAVTRGVSWASVAMTTAPSPTLRLVVQAKDAGSAQALGKVARDALGLLVGAARSNPDTAELADALARMKPEAGGDRVTLEADLEKTAALVFVPVRQLRESARRTRCVKNLLQIGLAMHNHLFSHNNVFPAAFVADKDGKPLLSWRVMILPFLDQKELFDQFHLDEPWDGPHNKPLIAKMPKVFACPNGNKALAAEGKTTYLTPRGPGTIFPGAVGVKIQDVTDGTSNTLMVVEAADSSAVIWTKPDDWEVGPASKIQDLVGHHPRGTNFGFADGSVRFLMGTVTPKLLQALLTRKGDEVLNADDF